MDIKSRLKSYYKEIKEIEKYKEQLKHNKEKALYYKDVLNNSLFTLNSDLGCQQYSDEIKGQGGKPISKVEQELERKLKQLENYIEHYEREEAYLLDKIFNLELDIKDLEEALINVCTELEREILEKRYKEEKTLDYISNKYFNGATSTMRRKLTKVLEEIEFTLSGRKVV